MSFVSGQPEAAAGTVDHRGGVSSSGKGTNAPTVDNVKIGYNNGDAAV